MRSIVLINIKKKTIGCPSVKYVTLVANSVHITLSCQFVIEARDNFSFMTKKYSVNKVVN
jgi:hypothetical protein